MSLYEANMLRDYSFFKVLLPSGQVDAASAPQGTVRPAVCVGG